MNGRAPEMCPTEGGLDRIRKFLGSCPLVCSRGAMAAPLACVLAVFATVSLLAPATAAAQTRSLELYFTHTKESIKVVFKRNGRFDAGGVRDLNRFLRDWRRNESTKMDPELFDLLWEVQQEFGGRKIYIVSAYRSPATNAMLRSRSRGVAKNSQHMAGKAIDFYIPGANLSKLRAAGIKRQVGGVGYYPRSGSPFVHFDTGSVRAWPRMSYSELAQIFPDGKTLHIASNGKTLKNYAAAQQAEKSGQLASLGGGGGGGGSGFSLFGFGGNGGSGRQVASLNEDSQRGILPQRSRPQEEAKEKDEPVRVQTASLGPTDTSDDEEDQAESGFFSQLPGASLGGLIGRFTGGKEDEEENKVTPVALPQETLTAVAVETPAGNGEIERVLEQSAPPPVPRLAPAEVRAGRGDNGAQGETGSETVREVIELAALPPQRPELQGIASDAGNPLAYARPDSAIEGRDAPMSATAAFVPQREDVLQNAPLGELGAIRPTSRTLSVPVLKASLSPVRGASPMLIANDTSIEEGEFADLSPADRDNASKSGLLMADGFLGAPTTFASAPTWPSAETFSGLRITVYARRPRS